MYTFAHTGTHIHIHTYIHTLTHTHTQNEQVFLTHIHRSAKIYVAVTSFMLPSNTLGLIMSTYLGSCHMSVMCEYDV